MKQATREEIARAVKAAVAGGSPTVPDRLYPTGWLERAADLDSGRARPGDWVLAEAAA